MNRVGDLSTLTRVFNINEDLVNNPPVSIRLPAPDYSTARVGEVLYLVSLPSNEDAQDYLSSLAVQKDPSTQRDASVSHIQGTPTKEGKSDSFIYIFQAELEETRYQRLKGQTL
jgi:hypothetical protein